MLSDFDCSKPDARVNYLCETRISIETYILTEAILGFSSYQYQVVSECDGVIPSRRLL